MSTSDVLLLRGFLRDPLSDNVAQFPLQDLPDRADGEGRHHFKPFGQLECGNLLRTKMRDELVKRQVGTRVEDDTRARPFTKDRIRHRHDADLPDLTEAEDQVFDFIATDFLAASIDEVL